MTHYEIDKIKFLALIHGKEMEKLYITPKFRSLLKHILWLRLKEVFSYNKQTDIIDDT